MCPGIRARDQAKRFVSQVVGELSRKEEADPREVTQRSTPVIGSFRPLAGWCHPRKPSRPDLLQVILGLAVWLVVDPIHPDVVVSFGVFHLLRVVLSASKGPTHVGLPRAEPDVPKQDIA